MPITIEQSYGGQTGNPGTIGSPSSPTQWKPVNKVTKESNSMLYVPIATPITMHDAQRWNGKMYKKLGFMALMKSQGKMHKVVSYLKSIEDLIASINARMAGIKDAEKLRDLNTTLDRAKLLKDFATKLLA
jgi:hypothetical protein